MKNINELEEKMIEYLGKEELLNSLLLAMSEEEKRENFEYIARMYDIDINDLQ